MDQESFWVGAKALAEEGDANALVERLDEFVDDAERFAMGRFLIRKLAFDAWENRNLDVIVAIADHVIADRVRRGGESLQEANIVCFNMAANLADCWDDGFEREPRHFEKGIEYANKAIAYRERLAKGPGSMAMAVWALAKHQLSLGRIEEARANFRRCLQLETEAAVLVGKPAEIEADAPDGYLIAAGYFALMEEDRRMRQGTEHQTPGAENQTPEPEKQTPGPETQTPGHEKPGQDALSALGSALRQRMNRGGQDRENAKIIAAQIQITANSLGIPLNWGFEEPPV